MIWGDGRDIYFVFLGPRDRSSVKCFTLTSESKAGNGLQLMDFGMIELIVLISTKLGGNSHL